MRLRGLWLVIVLVASQALYLYSRFPSPEQYRPAADEGTFFRAATTVLDRGPVGLRVLAREFLTQPELQGSPPPLRIGHLLLAATALSIHRSFRSLSALSLVAHLLLVLVTYGFVRRWRGDGAAICAAVLVGSAPLGSGLATRALSDSEYGLFVVLAALLCIEWSISGRRSTGAWAIATLAWAAIVKELTFMFLPAFAAVIAVGSRRRQGRVDWSGLATLALVPIAAGVVYAVAFGGAGTALSLLTTTQRMNAFATNEYLRLYHDGPWFTFFVHALLLAPLFTLTFLALCGWYAARRPGGEAELLLLVFIGAGIATFACLPHNPRYSNPLDVLMRVFAGAAIASIAAAARSRAIRRACVGAVAVLAAADVYAFHQLWVDNRIYDPTSATLVAARRLVPSVPPAVTLTAAEYVSLSLAYYRAHDYEATIAMSRRALAIGGETADAYNNIGAAYCELGRWNDAIPALETALRLRPGFQLARNNLAWARSEVGR